MVTLKVKGKYEDIIKGIIEEKYNNFTLTKEGKYATLTVKEFISSSKSSEYWDNKPVVKLYMYYPENMVRGHFEVVVDGIRKLNIDIELPNLFIPTKKLSYKMFREISDYKFKENKYEQAKTELILPDSGEDYFPF